MIDLAALLRELYPPVPPGLHCALHTLRLHVAHGLWFQARILIAGESTDLRYARWEAVIPQLLWATPTHALPAWVTGD